MKRGSGERVRGEGEEGRRGRVGGRREEEEVRCSFFLFSLTSFYLFYARCTQCSSSAPQWTASQLRGPTPASDTPPSTSLPLCPSTRLCQFVPPPSPFPPPSPVHPPPPSFNSPSNHSLQVYLYSFNHIPSSQTDPCYKVQHSAELGFVFGGICFSSLPPLIFLFSLSASLHSV